MKILSLASVVFLMGIVAADNAETTANPNNSTSSAIPSATSPTAVPSPTSTTAAPSISASTTTSTTVPPTQSTTPTTATPTQSTTPTTATPPPPTTPAPPAPTPKPKPKEYLWNVTEDGVTCILATAEIKLALTYFNETSKQEIKKEILVPANATSSGKCGNSSQILELSFDNDTVAFKFASNKDKYHIVEILSTVTVADGTNATKISLTSGNLTLFETHLNTSYGCSWSEPATLRENDAQRNITKASMRITLTHMRFEAFRNSTEDEFSKEFSCPMDSVDIVPVMVGIALGILVAVVLIAYLVGRRSTQAQGYTSM